MARVEFHTSAFIAKVDKAVNSVCYEGAKHMVAGSKRRATRDRAMKSAIVVRKSRFKNGGFVAGVFDKSSSSGKWEDSLAARAIYQSYGHAKPYRGRGYRSRKSIVKEVPGNDFFRKSLRATRIAVNRFAKGALKD